MLSNPKEMEEKLDPRVKRTRGLILRSFEDLLAEKNFEAISVQDVTECPPATRRVPIPRPMFPAPIIVTFICISL